MLSYLGAMCNMVTYFFLLLLLAEHKCDVILINDFAKLVEVDEKYMKVTEFRFYKKSRTQAALNVSYTTFVDIDSDDKTKVIFQALQFKDNMFKKTVINFAVGICTIYKTNRFDAFNLIKHSNLTGCPFPKGGYYIHDMSPTASFLPPFFPEGKWLLDISFTYNNNIITRVHWMLSVFKKI